jgi:hypothetical protein
MKILFRVLAIFFALSAIVNLIKGNIYAVAIAFFASTLCAYFGWRTIAKAFGKKEYTKLNAEPKTELLDSIIRNQWYKKDWKLILVSISIPILGIWGIWKSEKIMKIWKIVFTIISALISFRLIMFIKNDYSTYLIYVLIVAAIFLYITIAEHSTTVFYGLLLVTVLGLTLPFHYITSGDIPIVLKENLTFKNTIVTEYDVKKIIERYNHASLFERASIENEPLVKKLKELKILIPTNEHERNEQNN